MFEIHINLFGEWALLCRCVNMSDGSPMGKQDAVMLYNYHRDRMNWPLRLRKVQARGRRTA